MFYSFCWINLNLDRISPLIFQPIKLQCAKNFIVELYLWIFQTFLRRVFYKKKKKKKKKKHSFIPIWQ